MTTSNIAGGFRTTGLYPLSRDAIQLPGECNFADKMITPNVGFTHISAANSLLRSRFPSQNGLHDTCILKQKGVWISDSDGFVQIVHVSTGHWACLSNKFSSLGTLELFDSLHTVPEEGDTIIPQACSILRTPEPSLIINVVNVGRQEGGSNCGLYAIAMAYDLCAGVDPVSKK